MKEDNDAIKPSQQTDRQRWAFGFLAESFHKAETLFALDKEERNREIHRLLSGVGYRQDEIEPVRRHFNAGITFLDKAGEAAKARTIADIERTIAEHRHQPPPPKPD